MSLRELLAEKKELENRIDRFDFDWSYDCRTEDALVEYVNESCCETVTIFGMEYHAAETLRAIDKIAYRELMNDETDNLLSEREDNQGILRSIFAEYDRLFDELSDVDERIGERIDFAGKDHDDQGIHPDSGFLVYCEIDIADDAPGMYRFTSQAFPGKSAILTEDELDIVDMDYEYMPFGYVDVDTVKSLFGIDD